MGTSTGQRRRAGPAANYGTVFKITPSGTLTTLYSFCSQSELRGRRLPLRWPVQATNGDLYGTTGDVTGGGATSLGRSSKSPRVAR